MPWPLHFLAVKRLINVLFRDSGFKLSYRDLSSTPYSNRKAVEITWSKIQDVAPEIPLPDIVSTSKPRSMCASMSSVSAATALQAESYISVVSLFIITSSSPREGKVSMKLPGVWRDLWEELSTSKKEHEDAADREIVKNIKDLVEQVKSQADEDIVLTENFKRRNGTEKPASGESQQGKLYNSQSSQLQELWMHRSSTYPFQEMLTARMALPIWPFKEHIIEMLSTNRVLIICSETGSGKSTQIPSFILENELKAGRPCTIYVTEPRRISAMSLAKRVSEELGEGKNAVGTSRSLVGYAIRLESKVSASSRLIFA